MLEAGLVFDWILWLLGQSKEGHYNRLLEPQTPAAPEGLSLHLLMLSGS